VDHAEDTACLKWARSANGGYGLCFRSGPPYPLPPPVPRVYSPARPALRVVVCCGARAEARRRERERESEREREREREGERVREGETDGDLGG